MEITIYSARNLQYLLLPSFLLPSHQDEQQYGPLVLCGEVVVDGDDMSTLWRRLLAVIRQHRSVAITVSTAHSLLGDDHACLQPPETASAPMEGRMDTSAAGG